MVAGKWQRWRMLHAGISRFFDMQARKAAGRGQDSRGMGWNAFLIRGTHPPTTLPPACRAAPAQIVRANTTEVAPGCSLLLVAKDGEQGWRGMGELRGGWGKGGAVPPLVISWAAGAGIGGDSLSAWLPARLLACLAACLAAGVYTLAIPRKVDHIFIPAGGRWAPPRPVPPPAQLLLRDRRWQALEDCCSDVCVWCLLCVLCRAELLVKCNTPGTYTLTGDPNPSPFGPGFASSS